MTIFLLLSFVQVVKVNSCNFILQYAESSQMPPRWSASATSYRHLFEGSLVTVRAHTCDTLPTPSAEVTGRSLRNAYGEEVVYLMKFWISAQ